MLQPAGVTGQASASFDDPVTGDEDRDGIVSDRSAHRLCRDEQAVVYRVVFLILHCPSLPKLHRDQRPQPAERFHIALGRVAQREGYSHGVVFALAELSEGQQLDFLQIAVLSCD